ncbi:SDR family NAD(P)-dependent oxidoreductase [Gemmobacter serpentinus]|uniref:SDR family NAD(P)-dependent oxidoreductase n=1 Tax=Gemmobacter serpentinus TaxID=2652247 RepID=UPI00124DEF6E|nr:SDR family oxidoreductase [Gemmobacter serpentinus]
MSLSLQGKTAIVTGAANGLGLAIARHFVDKGANVMFADMDEARLEAEIGEEARAEGSLRMFAGDLRQKLAITNLLSATMDAFERVDILVNASRQTVLSDPLCIEEDGVEAMLQQNLMTSLRISQLAAKRMIAQGDSGGAIINLSSIAARQTRPELMAYSIACAAIDQMTRAMALALAPKGIRVNALALGSVMSASLQTQLKEAPDYRETILRGTPLGRIAAASEIVETAQFLASDAAAFITGQVITVDGGRSLLDVVPTPAH